MLQTSPAGTACLEAWGPTMAITSSTVISLVAALAAVVISALVAVLTWWYFRANVAPPVAAGYGFYIGAVCALAALACSVWALASALFRN